MPDPPKLDYAAPKRRRRSTWREHLVWAAIGLLWSIIVGVVLLVASWIFSRH